eukprot:407423_1
MDIISDEVETADMPLFGVSLNTKKRTSKPSTTPSIQAPKTKKRKLNKLQINKMKRYDVNDATPQTYLEDDVHSNQDLDDAIEIDSIHSNDAQTEPLFEVEVATNITDHKQEKQLMNFDNEQKKELMNLDNKNTTSTVASVTIANPEVKDDKNDMSEK